MYPELLSRVQYPRLTGLVLVGAAILALAGVLALMSIGSAVLTFRVGVLGYLFVLVGGAGYIALRVSNSLDDM